MIRMKRVSESARAGS